MAKKHKKSTKKSGITVKKVLMSIAIALVLSFFFGYGVATFYKEPQWENYCEERGPSALTTQDSCEESGGKWTSTPKRIEAVKLGPNQYLCTKGPSIEGEEFILTCETMEDQEQEAGWCNINHACEAGYETARENHGRIAFIILAVLGLIAILKATVFLKENSVSYGVMAGGIMTLIYASMRYWGNIPDIARFTILGVALIALVTVAYKKLR